MNEKKNLWDIFCTAQIQNACIDKKYSTFVHYEMIGY